MTDFVVISPDGELTEHDGYAPDEVGCHNAGGQMLFDTRTQTDQGPSMLRMTGCDCALLMPEEHPYSPVAMIVLATLGYNGPVRGRVALYRVDREYEPIPLFAADVKFLRAMVEMAKHVRAAQAPADQPAAAAPEAMMRVYRVDLTEEGNLEIDEIPPSGGIQPQ